jgi:hypothetical protein
MKPKRYVCKRVGIFWKVMDTQTGEEIDKFTQRSRAKELTNQLNEANR